MSEILCPHCARNVAQATGAAFCPFCGGALGTAVKNPESDDVRALLAKVDALDSPVKKHEMLMAALEQYPESLAVAEEVLFLGRLYERSARRLDFSVIKSYLLMIYLEPETFMPETIAQMRTELFSHPDLQRCLRLSDDQDAYLSHYLTKLSAQFIELFLRGSSKYMRRFFGIGMDSRAPRYLATPASRMLAAMQADTLLTPEQRALLMHAFYKAFSTQLSGETQWLSKEMQERGVVLR